MRNYIAQCDNGHEYFCIEFQSEHRAGSKANEEDAKKALKLGGHKHARIIYIARNF